MWLQRSTLTVTGQNFTLGNVVPEVTFWDVGRNPHHFCFVEVEIADLAFAPITDSEFTQLIKGFQGERLRQAFRYFDKDGDGYIRPEEFQRIVLELAGHKLSDPVLERLPTLCTLSPGQKISYSEVIAFHNIIRGMS